MATGWGGGGGSQFLGSDGDPSDPVLLGPTAAFFSDKLKAYCGIYVEADVLVRFHGGICSGIRLSSIYALQTREVKGVGAVSSRMHSVAGRRLPAAPAIICSQEDGAILKIASLWIHDVVSPFLLYAQPVYCCLKQSVVLQVSMYMREGAFPNPHCSTSFEDVMPDTCWSVCDGHIWKVMLDEARRALWYASNEQHSLCSCSCTCLSLSHDFYNEDAVFMLFGLCHRRWTTTPPLLILRFNSRDALSLSSVKDIQYLQLNSIPLVHIPDRPSGEPPAGHQLDRTFETLEDYRCGNIESELSTDKRSLFGSICDLQHLLHEFRSSTCCVVQLGTYLSCSTAESHVMMYLDP